VTDGNLPEPVLLLEEAGPPSGLRQQHQWMLAISVFVLVMSALLVIRPDQKVALWCLPNWPAPESCMSRTALGVPCPGCGLTRSFIALAHGEFARSWNYNRVGWLLALVTLAQIPYRLWSLRHPTGAPLGRVFPHVLAMTLIGMLILNWIWGWLQ